jgi:uncharacterized protein (TIGR02996 family)
MKELEKARELLAKEDQAGALRQLLLAWRKTRAPAIAGAVAAVGRRLRATQEPLNLSKKGQEVWMALADGEDPADLDRLLETVADGARSGPAVERIERLAAWPPDPRIAAALVRLVRQPPFSAGTTKPFWKAVLALLVELRDPVAAAALRELVPGYSQPGCGIQAATMAEWMRGQLEGALEELSGAADKTLSAEELALCAEISGARAPGPTRAERSDEALLAAVLADPDDDAARTVYGDFLQEQGDARGELIRLQLARGRGGKPTTRERKLIEENAQLWLGPLAPAVTKGGLRFERGFLAACDLGGGRADKALARLVGHPLWSTVEDLGLKLSSGDEQVMSQLVLHPTMRALRVVRHASPAVFAALLAAPSPLRLTTLTTASQHTHTEELRQRSAPVDSLPALRVLGFEGFYGDRWTEGQIGRFLRTPLGAQLEALEVVAEVTDLEPFVRQLATARTLRRLSLTTGTFDRYHVWFLVLERRDEGVHLEVGIESRVHDAALARFSQGVLQLASLLDKLDARLLAGVTTLVHGKALPLAPVEKAAERFSAPGR